MKITAIKLAAFVLIVLGLTGGSRVSAQTLRSGDSLTISVLQDPKLDRTVLIDPQGEIAFPLAGHFRARGLTPEAVENVLKSRLRDKYKEGLDITVAVASVGTTTRQPIEEEFKPKVFLTGEVTKPGSYTVLRPTTLVQAIALAGGLSPFAAKQRIQVRRRVRGSELIFPFDYRAYEAGLDIAGNITLLPGDTVLVPERGLLE